MTKKKFSYNGMEVAIIGMSGKFPLAKDTAEYWDNLKNGKNCVTFFSDDDLIKMGTSPEIIKKTNFVKAEGYMFDKDKFDANFFGFTPIEAELLDPQIRVFYEVCWEALENSSYDPLTYRGNIGLYAGATNNFYWELLTNMSKKGCEIGICNASHLTDKDFLSTRISHSLNLKGPSVSLQTACSTSLTAIHMATQALLNGECNMALAGGVTIWVSPNGAGYIYEEGTILSSDGYCRAFDAKSDGTIAGNGAGVVVLKLLEDAIEDGDNILAVIKGSVINNDGSDKANYAAPSRKGQTNAIKMALQVAEVESESISYIEAHGTGTNIGDPIEIEALVKAFNTDKKQYCPIGTVKTNIGHLDNAAGVAGVIKTVLALQNKQIPPSLNFESPNPKINFEKSPFFVNTSLREWKNDEYPLRAGVSSFGVGGTNAHIILEEAPEKENGSVGRKDNLILVSARSKTALENSAQNLSKHLLKNPEYNISDVAFTLKLGRAKFSNRMMLTASSIKELSEKITSKKYKTSICRDLKHRTVFMFPGQGGQYFNMGKDLFESEPIFRKELKKCFEIYNKQTGENIENKVFIDDNNDINQTKYAQPLIFIFEYALAKYLIKLGIKPDAMIGHSIGEYTAACLSDVFSLEDAIKIVIARGEIMQTMPIGTMIGVEAKEDVIKEILEDGIEVACINSTDLCVISGKTEAINSFKSKLDIVGISSQILQTSHAFHSAMMEPAVNRFKEVLDTIKLNTPCIPFISNITGTWITDKEALDQTYWAMHIRNRVNYLDGLGELLKSDDNLFLEVGPGNSNTQFVLRHENKKDNDFAINLMRHPKERVSDSIYFIEKLGELWLKGVEINWDNYYKSEKRRRVELPTYPFERQRFWPDDEIRNLQKNGFTSHSNSCASVPTNKELTKGKNANEWVYKSVWEKSLKFEEKVNSKKWLVFSDNLSLEDQINKNLVLDNKEVITVKIGICFVKLNKNSYEINPLNDEDYVHLFKDLAKTNNVPNEVVHYWSLTKDLTRIQQIENTEQLKNLSFYSLNNIAKAIGEIGFTEKIRFNVVTNDLFKISSQDSIYPEKAIVLGAIKVIPLEYLNITCRIIDSGISGKVFNEFKNSLYNESLSNLLFQGSSSNIYSIRNNECLTQEYQKEILTESQLLNPKLKENGVYIIIGGMGGIGYEFTKHIATNYKSKIIVISRSSFPEKKEWNKYLNDKNSDKKISDKIKEIQHIEKKGGQIFIEKADIADYTEMLNIVNNIYLQHGKVNGVIHSAGIIDDAGIIQRRTKKMTNDVLRSKVDGVQVLEKIFTGKNLDILVLFSSIGNVTYEMKFGQVGYNAANEYLDAYTYANSELASYILTINWTDWTDVGMTHRTMTEEDKKAVEVGGVNVKEGLKVFDIICENNLKHAIVMPTDLHLIKEKLNTKTQQISDNKVKDKKTYDRPNIGTEYVEPKNELEVKLVEIWEDNFGYKPIGVEDNFFELGGDSLKGMRFVNRYKELLNAVVHVSVIFDAPTITELAIYFKENYTNSISNLSSEVDNKKRNDNFCMSHKVSLFLEKLPTIELTNKIDKTIDTPVVFILSPPREGSTLLRIMLGGHPEIFSPQEISMLYYNNMGEMEKSNPSVHAAVNAIMRLKGCDVDEAKMEINNFIDQNHSVSDFLNHMHQLSENKIFVYKSPSYALYPEILKRIKAQFSNVKFIHLCRNPYGMINSFEENKMDLFYGKNLTDQLEFTRREIAEMIWYTSHNNIVDFSKGLDESQYIRVKYEELVSNPEIVTRELSNFLLLEYHPYMIQPYRNSKELMTDGIVKDGLMIGDIKFHEHKTINSENATRWRDKIKLNFISNESIEIAKSFGYEDLDTQKDVKEGHLIESELEVHPASPQQVRLYNRYVCEESKTKKLGDHFIQIFILEGKLDKNRIDYCFNQIFKRHENYRIGFDVIDNEVVQKIYKESKHVVKYFSCEDNEVAVRKVIDEFARDYDLSIPPLMETAIIQVAPEKNYVVMNSNHMITDGASQIIVINELAAFLMGKNVQPVNVTYRDYVKWYNSEENKQELEKQKEFWLNIFNSMDIPELSLPLDFERPKEKGVCGFTSFHNTSKELTDKIRKYAISKRVSLYDMLISSYFVLLKKISKQNEIIIGTSVSGRKEDFNYVVGYFLNLLPIYSEVNGAITFGTFIKEIHDFMVLAGENRYYQFEQLLEDMEIEVDDSTNPIFNAFFHFITHDYRKSEDEAKEDVDLKLIEYGYEGKSAKYEIELVTRDEGESLLIYFIYRNNLFRNETLELFIAQLLGILEKIVILNEITIDELVQN